MAQTGVACAPRALAYNARCLLNPEFLLCARLAGATLIVPVYLPNSATTPTSRVLLPSIAVVMKSTMAKT